MPNDLSSAAQALIRRIQDANLGLLSELPTGESEVQQLIDHLSIYIASDYRDVSTIVPVLTLVAVHIAANADESHSAFRNLLYARLKFAGNGDMLWQNLHGPAIRSFLETTFPDVDLPESGKPYAFVGSVYRHCGVPPSARRWFAELLAGLVLRQGWHFSRSDLRLACSDLPSPVLRDFLTSDAGFSFCRRICQFTAAVLEKADSVVRVPEYRRTLVSAVLESIRQRQTAIPVYWPEPEIRFDPNHCRVEVWLDPKGLGKAAYTDQQGRAIDQLVFDISECPAVINVAGTAWRVEERWERRRRIPAYFRRTSGVLVEHPNLTRKEWFVLSCSVFPEQGHDWKETGTLTFRDVPNTIWRVLSSSSTGEATIASSRPYLKWLGNGSASNLGGEFFIGKLPAVRVEGVELPSEVFEIELCTSSHVRIIPLTSDSIEIINVPEGPGYLRLLRKGDAFDDSRLPFMVLPRGFHASVLELAVGETDPFHIHILIPAGWSLSFSAPHDLVRGGLYRFSGGEWTVAATLKNGRSTISLDLPVPRVFGRNRRAEVGQPDDRIVWDDEMDSVLLSAAIEGDVLLTASDVFRSICAVSAESGTRILEFDKALTSQLLQEQPITTAVFKVRDRVVQTGLYFASSEYISDALTEGHWDVKAICGPSNFTKWLEQMSALSDGTASAMQQMSLPRNQALCRLTRELQFGSAVFDRGLALRDSGTKLPADSALLRAGEWYQRAKSALRKELDSGSELVKDWPQRDIEVLKLARWRALLAETRNSLVKLSFNARHRMNTIRVSVKSSPYLMPAEDLAKQPGGVEFLKALQAYTRAGENKTRRTMLLVLANTHVDAALQQSSDVDLLIPIASLLKALILFRARKMNVATEIVSGAPKPELLKGAFEDLTRACETGVLRFSVRNGNEVHLTDLFDAWPTDVSGDRGNNGSSTRTTQGTN
jgi:hypothetical protein